MKYFIYYSPVFHKGDKSLAGYNMYISKKPKGLEMMDVITVECENWKEYDRYKAMLSGVYDPFDEMSFVDKHPMKILKYLRGEKEEPKRTPDWEKQVDRWSVNLRGERV